MEILMMLAVLMLIGMGGLLFFIKGAGWVLGMIIDTIRSAFGKR